MLFEDSTILLYKEDTYVNFPLRYMQGALASSMFFTYSIVYIWYEFL